MASAEGRRSQHCRIWQHTPCSTHEQYARVRYRYAGGVALCMVGAVLAARPQKAECGCMRAVLAPCTPEREFCAVAPRLHVVFNRSTAGAACNWSRTAGLGVSMHACMQLGRFA